MFTSNQIEEIRKKLQLCGIKDTEFMQVDSIGYDDIIAIVHQGQNRKITIGQFLQEAEKFYKGGIGEIHSRNFDGFNYK